MRSYGFLFLLLRDVMSGSPVPRSCMTRMPTGICPPMALLGRRKVSWSSFCPPPQFPCHFPDGPCQAADGVLPLVPVPLPRWPASGRKRAVVVGINYRCAATLTSGCLCFVVLAKGELSPPPITEVGGTR